MARFRVSRLRYRATLYWWGSPFHVSPWLPTYPDAVCWGIDREAELDGWSFTTVIDRGIADDVGDVTVNATGV